eukprot:scaffold2911_cov414-Prasinococcus_capsulatus_cf.AAC.5
MQPSKYLVPPRRTPKHLSALELLLPASPMDARSRECTPKLLLRAPSAARCTRSLGARFQALQRLEEHLTCSSASGQLSLIGKLHSEHMA